MTIDEIMARFCECVHIKLTCLGAYNIGHIRDTLVDNNSSNTTNIYLPNFDVSTSVRGLHQKKLVLSSSGSWHDWKMPCQESGRRRD